MAVPRDSRCPVCRASFRGSRECSRCGADLGPLMLLALEAFQCRRDARAAIRDGDFEAAHDLADQARAMHDTGAGKDLLLLARWLDEQDNRAGNSR